jgi:phosphoribosylamine-glycine ligase
MKILLMSNEGDGMWFASLMAREGHEVSIALNNDEFKSDLEEIIRPASLVELSKMGPPENYDLIFFENTGMGEIADYARQFTPTIGDSVLADTLEHDRLFGLDYMSKCGIKVPPFEHFDNPADGISYLKTTKQRVVFKPIGMTDCASTYVSKDFEDMIRFMDVLFRTAKVKEYILQKFIPGTELSTEMWVTQDSYCAVNHTLETKKLFTGDIGPATGCSGSVSWMPARETAAFRRGLKLAAKQLISDGFCGPVDLNSICADGEVYGLEWTPRFGYEAACNLTRLLPIPFSDFLYKVASGNTPNPLISQYAFAATTRLSVPPYPLISKSRKLNWEGVPIEGIDLKDWNKFFLSDVRLVPDSDRLETTAIGYIGSPIGVGDTMDAAFQEVTDKIKSLDIPNLQWRNDVGECCMKRYRELQEEGWLRQS